MGVIRNKIPWDLRQRGQMDSNRHAKKVKEAIRENLQHIIAEEEIISTDGKRTTKIPIKYLDSYHFRHGVPKDGVGHGEGKEGDVLKEGDKDGMGKGKAGDKPGSNIYDAEVSIEELTKMMLEDLGLPWFEDKEKKQIITRHVRYTDLRKTGPMPNWHKKKTILENIRRNASEGREPKFGDLKQDDMRFRTWDEVVERHSNAVVYLMMDRSGSMDEPKRYLCKATFWWLCRFLEHKYDNVEVVFIAHDYDARVVPEKDFFILSNDGGTRCSSAYELCLSDIKDHRPLHVWNIYCFHFSDGDNWGDDNNICVNLVKEILNKVNMFAYGQVEYGRWGDFNTALLESLKSIDHPRMMTTVLSKKEDVYAALQSFLGKEVEKTQGD